MYALEYQMPTLIHAADPLIRMGSPSHEHNAALAPLRDHLNNLPGQPLPALTGVAPGVAGTNGKGSVEHQHATLRPGD
jgi:folylpolyglutamate synthase/dihydropteroate synthase